MIGCTNKKEMFVLSQTKKNTLRETSSLPIKITIFPGKYHQKRGDFSMVMLIYRSVPISTYGIYLPPFTYMKPIKIPTMKSWIGIPESSDGWRFAKVLTWLMPSSSFPALVERGADKKDPKMIPW